MHFFLVFSFVLVVSSSSFFLLFSGIVKEIPFLFFISLSLL